MQETLIRRLHDYMRVNNPDMLVKLQAEGKVTDFLKNKVSGIDSLLNELLVAGASPLSIEEICMKPLTEDLQPSKYAYVMSVLLDSFGATYVKWRKDNVLLYEVINILQGCEEYFERWGFNDDSTENALLLAGIKGHIRQYIKNQK